MSITAGDIKFLKSQVFDDVPEGGQGPTGDVINDGTSNGIFNDISELDRALGRVNLRKMFVSVQTENVDSYFGTNIIIAEPYSDPRVCATLFQTDDFFDDRTSAANRIESYLSKGPTYSGYLFGDHIAGQATVTLLQRVEISLPTVGSTMLLRKNEGLGTQYDEYIRITDVSSTLRTFTDQNGDFQRTQVVLQISNPLNADFNGFEAMRLDSSINYTNRTKICETIVADASRYYGTVKLAEAVSVGDFTAKGESIYTQLVPSTRIEAPIVDARVNQQRFAAVESGDAVTLSLDGLFTAAQPLYIGGSILPGSLTASRNGVTLIDKGGVLQSGGANVGTIDYDNGILRLSTNVFSTGVGTHTVTFKPSAQATVVSDTLGIEVTAEGQRLNWAYTIDPIPARGTLQVSYRTLNKWYTLTDDGSGALRGSDSAFGAGSLNYSTGTVSITLGALPDVDSRIINAWASPATTKPVTQLVPSTPGFVRIAEKIVSLNKAVKPGTISLSWNDGAARTATDVNGALTGDASGPVYYNNGVLHFRPNTLPAKGTAVTLTVSEAVQQIGEIATFVDGGSAWTFTLAAPVKTRSVELSVVVSYSVREFPGVDKTQKSLMRVFDDGNGNLQIANQTSNLNVGTVNYSSGACTIVKSVGSFKSEQPKFQNTVPLGASGDPSSYVKVSGYETRTLTLAFLNGPGGDTLATPAWAWWVGAQGDAGNFRYGSTDGATAQAYPFTLDELTISAADQYAPYFASLYSGFEMQFSLREFGLGSDRYVVRNNGAAYDLILNPQPSNGEGSIAGSVSGMRTLVITQWSTGVSPTPTYFNSAASNAVSGEGTLQLVDSATARTAVSPLVNGGFNIAGTWQDGTTFTATANSSGVISSGTANSGVTPGSLGVFGVVDYEMGIVDLRFGRRVADDTTGARIIDVSTLGIPGVNKLESAGVRADTLRYNAVGYNYLPLDPDILGLNTVRLPADGRVPIMREGSVVVIGNTQTITGNVTNGQTVNCGRVRLSRVRVLGNNGLLITTGYTVDLDLGTVTFTNVSGYSQPVSVEHRIEDMLLVSDVQINGQLSFTRAVTHNYPVSGSYISSALVKGDIRARANVLFDQGTWNNTWSDTIQGSTATGTFNDAQYPIVVNNKGALKERWAVVFTNNTNFNVIGERVGVIASGNTSAACSPMNPESGTPYFTIPAEAWGLGWAAGNAVRFNTEAAMIPFWCVRTTLQGPETVGNDNFVLLSRGDIDRP